MSIDAMEAALEARLNRESAAKLYGKGDSEKCRVCGCLLILGMTSETATHHKGICAICASNPGTDVCEQCAGRECQ